LGACVLRCPSSLSLLLQAIPLAGMKFPILSSLIAGAALVSASHIDQCKYDVVVTAAIDFDLALHGCPVITPKVVIISMVRDISSPGNILLI
jgi:hypothetical protein